ncbi:MAG: FapA family protein, partial [Desulfohalobiaceae bacterium]
YQAQVIVGQNVAAYKNDKPLAVQSQEPLKSGQGQEKNTDESPRNLQGQVVTEPGVEFRALLPGVVGWNGKTISVLEAIQIKGDVDYSTGNIEFKKGSVHVQGSIKSGFSLKTPGNVYVKQSVEGAVPQAGGDCVVNIGLSMQEKGSVTVGGSLQAHFMENATVKAKGDIFITHDIINSLIQTLGQVQATKGRGKIQGGLIRAATGVQCNVLGSERGVSTRIVLSFVAEGDPALIQRRDQLKRKLQKIQEVLGEDNYQTLLEKTPKEKHPQLVEMLKNKSKILAELKELKPKIKESKQELTQRTMESKIVVKDKVYPGVEITIAQESLEVKETLHSPTFYLDQESMAIKIA